MKIYVALCLLAHMDGQFLPLSDCGCRALANVDLRVLRDLIRKLNLA